MDEATLLSVRDLTVAFETRRGSFDAVRGVSFDVQAGKTLGVVGESGSGKSVTAMALMQLLPDSAQVMSGSVHFAGRELGALSEREMLQVRGREIAMVFQDPMASLNPILTVGYQLMEPLRLHMGLGKAEARTRGEELLALVRIPSPSAIMRAYPHELSGGMRQRVMIAMALAPDPQMLVADEPTTALDATVQYQVIQTLRRINKERHLAMLIITHDLGMVAELCDQVYVMHGGKIVESADVFTLFDAPKNDYTASLLAAARRLHQTKALGTP
jgi:ABC-type dipeptide/oligopeptide/nickel transport system ATPase component